MAISGFTGQRVGAHTLITVNSATPTTITPDAEADFILIESHQHNLILTFDGSTPSATSGFTIAKDTPYKIDIGQGTTLKVLAKSNNPSVSIQSFRTKRDTDV